MLSSRPFLEHVPLILLVLNFIHQDLPLFLFLLFPELPSFLNLLWIQKVALFNLLLGINKTDRSLLFNEPLIGLLQVVQLIAFVVGINDLSEHLLQALKQLDHVTEIYTLGRLDFLVFLPDHRLLLSVPFLLYEEFNKPGPEPTKYWIVF